MSDLSSSSEGIYGGRGESVMSNTSNRERSTRGEKVRRKFCRHMELFLVEGDSCSYENESDIGSFEVQTSS
jgi:RNase P subunit RPR2